ncbi:chromosome segregation protein SMC [Portibacter marinus]|uniref:chromosome segregation protein SMC n=1 Tax=Portibacter marinus TaxID=2898660 RepID=UPI001F31089D|nr:chromosome segregation protein SMC [Portibacter marinus]
MRLKSLEIKGFKSFGNPTVLHFDENVTGIVGPNGSGKSNVVDAFRWVLGEQKSKELRLEQMGDVLFNGAAKKQQANLAEVSIIFDNTKNVLPTEYNTVKITRALYRSGDSEYRINDVVCRLKDIHILLMDTGIGSNSYSIIELGMVDDILQDKENARRRMFEQAAGISKFKKRKKETLQKLKLTNADLERIEDLLYEIEKNLKDLEKQAKRTKKYFEIKEKYKESSILLYKIKWDQLEEGVVSLNQKIEDNKKDYNDWVAELSKKEAILEEEKLKNLEGERHLSAFQKNLNDLLDDIRRSENEKNLLAQKISFSKNNSDKAKLQIASAEPQLEEIHRRKVSLEKQYLEREQEFKTHQTRLLKLQENVDQLNGQFQSNKQFQQDKTKNLQRFQESIFELDKKLAVTQNKIETFKRDKTESENEIINIKEGIGEQKDSLLELEKQLEIINQELNHLQEKEQNRKEVILKTENEITPQKDMISKINRKIDALTNEQSLLKSMVENMEGFSESVKFLHSQWDGRKVLLSDVINTEEKYRAAVEQVLQPYLNFFIVNDLQEARAAIQILQKAQKGKAQFFLLNEIDEQKTVVHEESLATVIQTEDKYRPLINLLCGNVQIISEKQLFNNSSKDQIIVSESGSIFKGPGQIAGGSVGLFEGKKIGRKKRIEHLDKQISKEKMLFGKEELILSELKEVLEKMKSGEFTHEIKMKERLRSDKERQVFLLRSKLDSSDQRITNIEARLVDLTSKIEETTMGLLEIKTSKEDYRNKVDALNDELNAQDSDLEKLNDELSNARNTYNEQNIALIKSENLLEGISKDIRYQDHSISELKQNLRDAKKTLEKQTIELDESTEKLDKLSEELRLKYQKRSSEQEDLTKAEQAYFKARALANEVEDDIRKLSKNINDKQYLINQLKDKLNDFKFRKNSIRERLSIEFEYKVSDLFDVEIEEGNHETELELQVEKYKRRLDNYGEINPMALEAYDEMEKRFIHITEQRDDINKAKVSLMNTISEIEETATQLFLDSFNEVRKHFVVVFRSLFTQGDDCDLVLEDENDPLNSKIEIIAKPKGKRPKSLSQLSGGEKTLTATALLFSLYLLKPAPFCIFDEVDAPLDDTNIQKFANIIRAFSDKSQFIIVTHNKATMAEVDVLYGVFMQKKGISSVSAVDFRSYEEKGTVANVELNTY